MVTAVEAVKGEKWESFQHRYGDWGRDAALYLGRKRCQLKLGELGRLGGGMDYGSVAVAVTRLAARLKKDAALAETMLKLETVLAKAEQ